MDLNITPTPSDITAGGSQLDAYDYSRTHVEDDLVDLALGIWLPDDVAQRSTALLDHLAECDQCVEALKYLRQQVVDLDEVEPDRWHPVAAILNQFCEAVHAEDPAHPHDELVRYAQLSATRGEVYARSRQPAVAQHLDTCTECQAELASMLELLDGLPEYVPPRPNKRRDNSDPVVPDVARPASPSAIAPTVRSAPPIPLRVAALVRVAVVCTVQSMQSVVAFAAAVTNYALKTAVPQPAADASAGTIAIKSIPTGRPRPHKATAWILDPTHPIPLRETLHLTSRVANRFWNIGAPQTLAAQQFWADACVIEDERIYLDALPILCARPEAESNALWLMLPQTATPRDISLVLALVGGTVRFWSHFAPIPWRHLVSHPMDRPLEVDLGAHRPLPGQPWHQRGVLRVSGLPVRRLLTLRRGGQRDGAHPRRVQLGAPPATYRMRFDLTGEGWEADGLANLALGVLHELKDVPEATETAIAYYEHALHYFPPAEHPLHYAAVRQRLAGGYRRRRGGRHDSNLKLAAETYAEAAGLFKRGGLTLDWAVCRVNQGNVLASAAGGRRSVLDRAIACYREALDALPREAHPLHYAAAQGNLGAAYADLAALGRGESFLEWARGAIEEALAIFTFDRFPAQYAMLQNRLGRVHHGTAVAFRRGPGSGDLHLAAYQEALKVYTRESYPVEYASVQLNLGRAYAQRVAEGRHDDVDRGLYCISEASSILTPEVFPAEHRQMRQFQIQLQAHKTRKALKANKERRRQ